VASTNYSISAASRLTGKSRTTITKHIRQGKLSCEIDERGVKLVDGSELARVYGDDFKLDVGEGPSLPVSPKAKASGGAEQGVQQQLHTVQLQLDMLIKERERERLQFEQQVQHLQDVLRQVQDAHNKALLMLEHRPHGAGEWERKFQELEEKIANGARSRPTKESLKPSNNDVLKDFKNHNIYKVLWARMSR
jgi:hypothetical protein